MTKIPKIIRCNTGADYFLGTIWRVSLPPFSPWFNHQLGIARLRPSMLLGTGALWWFRWWQLTPVVVATCLGVLLVSFGFLYNLPFLKQFIKVRYFYTNFLKNVSLLIFSFPSKLGVLSFLRFYSLRVTNWSWIDPSSDIDFRWCWSFSWSLFSRAGGDPGNHWCFDRIVLSENESYNGWVLFFNNKIEQCYVTMMAFHPLLEFLWC